MGSKLIYAALVLLASACGSPNNACTTDSECFRGEVCVDEQCQAPANNNTTAPVNNTSVTTTTTTTTNNDTTQTQNNTSTSTTNETVVTTGQCIVDPFTAMCPADDNDSFAEYVRTETGRGCLGGGDNFEGGEFTLLDQVLCPLEAADRYNTNLIPCDNITFVVEVTVIPHESCSQDDWDFNMRLQGNDCIETNGKMRCENLPDGSKRATGFLEPSNSITSPYIDITPITENLQFTYDVKIVVRE